MQSLTDVPLSIDSSIVAALEAGLAAYEGKALVNSVTGEDERLEQVLPLVAKHGAAVVAITNDETGISEDPDVRFARGREDRARAAADHGIRAADIVVDPLVMPIGALGGAGRQVFALVRRLHEELGVNTTCGASNISFGLPNRNGINGAFLAMAIASGMTSAITSPLHAEVRQAVMAADVLMGTDAALRGVDRAVPRASRPGGGRRSGRRGGREGRRRGAAAPRRIVSEAADALVVFTPSGKRGGSPTARTCWTPRRALGVDLDSVCGGRGICGRCQVVVSEGEFAEARHHLARPTTSRAFSAPEETYRERSGLAADRRLGCHARVCGDLVVDVPPESQLHRQVVRKEADAHAIEVDPVVRLHYVEVAPSPTWPTRAATCERLLEALETRLAAHRADGATPTCWPSCSASLRAGDWTATVAVHDGSTIIGDLAGVPRPAARRGVRRGLHHGGRPSVRPGERRRARVRRRDEPADPVRRGPDEPGVLRDDEPRRRGTS